MTRTNWLAIYNNAAGLTKRATEIEIEKQKTQDQLELELKIPKTLRTEFNFLKFPFFDLSKDSGREEIRIEEELATKEGQFHILWAVTRSVKGQFPGDFEKHLHRAIEQIINSKSKPLENPIFLGSLRYIAGMMGIHADSGKNYQSIRQAFKNIVKTTIEAKGTYRVKESKKKQYIDDTFHLYDRVIFRGESMPDGETADGVYLMLGSWYLQNMNNNYVVPLDWQFYTNLKGALTTRMYEYLSIYFYAALERNYEYHEVRYSHLCSYFPMKPQYPGWKARKQLKKAHEALTKSGYFKKIEWLETTETEDWLVRYWIGDKAKDEYLQNKREIKRYGVITSKPVPIPQRRRKRLSTNNTFEAQNGSESIQKLIDRGISPKVAETLSESHTEPYIAHKIEVLDWLVEKNSHLIKDNPPGFLRNSIIKDFNNPANFVSKEERERQAKLREEQKRRGQHQEKLREWEEWQQGSMEDKIKGSLWYWQFGFEKENKRKPTVDEIEIRRAEFIKEIPSDSEKYKQIFGKPLQQSENLFK